MEIGIDELPAYVNHNQDSLKSAQKKSLALMKIRKSFTDVELKTFKKSVKITTPSDDKFAEKMDVQYRKIGKDVIIISKLFTECLDYLSHLSSFSQKPEFRKLNSYVILFEDLGYLRQLTLDYERENENDVNRFYFIERLTQPYLNEMVSCIHFTNNILRLFTNSDEDEDEDDFLGEEDEDN